MINRISRTAVVAGAVALLGGVGVGVGALGNEAGGDVIDNDDVFAEIVGVVLGLYSEEGGVVVGGVEVVGGGGIYIGGGL